MSGGLFLEVLFCILLAMIVIDPILRKILNVKQKGFWGIYKHHNKSHAIIEEFLFYLVFLVFLCDFYFHFLEDPFVLFYILAVLIWLLRGVVEWQYSREGKEYIFNWLFSGAFLLGLIIKLVG
jgi:prepilin signal peptidase PulO-like enzyme (type II secretory pathway)